MERDEKGRFIKGTNGDLFEGYGKWYDKFGYPSIWIDGKNVMVHVFVWEREHGERPKGYHIHHIDKDKSNYELSNLLLVSPGDHQKIHHGWLSDNNGNWIKKPCKVCKETLDLELFYPRKGLTPSNVCKKCSSNLNKERIKNDLDFRENKKAYLKEYYKNNKEKFKKCTIKK